jgi:hypothetical protein
VNVSVHFWINGAIVTNETTVPYCSFGDGGGSCARVLKPHGYYTVEAHVLSNGIEVARQAIVVRAT